MVADLRQLIRYHRNHGFGERTRSISAHSSGRLTLLDLRQELALRRCMPGRILTQSNDGGGIFYKFRLMCFSFVGASPPCLWLLPSCAFLFEV
jgi:hypothetical protein